MGTGDAPAGTGEQPRQPRHQQRVGRRGVQLREVAGHRLVQADEFISFVPVEPPLFRQLREALPLRFVYGCKRVDVHVGTLPHMATGTANGAARFGEDLLITGEAVALEVRPASFLPRVVGVLMDAALYAMVVGTLAVRLTYAVELNEAQFATLMVTSIALIMVILPTVVETLSRGRSLGKLATGIRIVRDDGGPIRFRHAVVRALTGIGELWLTAGGVAIICSLVTRRGKRVGDVLAGTYALRVRGAERRSLPLVMPPELAEWAATADIAALPDAVALTARRFLDRTGSMEPAARTALGRDLAARVEPHV